MIRRLLALLILLCPLHAAAGRIVNVQSAASREAKEGLSGELSGLLNWTTGNTEITQVSAGLAALYLNGPHRLFLSARAAYGLDQGSAYINNTFEHLRYRYRLSSWLSPETFVQHEYDEFRRLSVRMLFGLGPRLEVPMPKASELAFGSAWMLEYQRFTQGEELDAGKEELNHRWSNYVAAAVEPTSGIGFTHTAYFQPRFDDFGDHRILSETAAVLDVKKWLAVKLAFTAIYDSRPAEEVEKLDTTFTTSLLFRINP